MEEQELRDEQRTRRREEKVRRDREELEAARAEGLASTWYLIKYKVNDFFSLERFSIFRKLSLYKIPILIALGCAASNNLTGSNTILYYSVDLMRMGGICDPLFTGVMIGVVKVSA